MSDNNNTPATVGDVRNATRSVTQYVILVLLAIALADASPEGWRLIPYFVLAAITLFEGIRYARKIGRRD